MSQTWFHLSGPWLGLLPLAEAIEVSDWLDEMTAMAMDAIMDPEKRTPPDADPAGLLTRCEKQRSRRSTA